VVTPVALSHGSPRLLATHSAATTPGMIFMDFKSSF